ncbi:MAG: LLM class flavin-dependent oxidoreductase [Actinobacteria bacterium]|uniref:Unannotated protein n=1 Tax=freshwater metagenome TaxID=449393 RepID=A0A6J7JTY4_9ZZZZ|nr:LLM class flavin-dependent oxidoreductase [Actinomycetota bacterium]
MVSTSTSCSWSPVTEYGSLSVVLPTRYQGPLLEYVELAARCEGWGYDGVWATEVAGADAFVLAAACGLATQRMTVGTGAVAVGIRSPAMIALSAATTSALVPGRFILGLGTSTPAIVTGWHGQPFEAPLRRLDATVDVVRAVLAGRESSGNSPLAPGSGFRVEIDPLPAPAPIYTAALRAASLRLAGRQADGAILTLTDPAHVGWQLGQIHSSEAVEGSTRAVVYVRCCVTEDPDGARSWMRRELAWYSTSSAYREHFASMGYEQAMHDIAEAWRRDRSVDGVAGLVPQTLIDDLMLAGSATAVSARLREFWEAGADDVALYPISADGSCRASDLAATLSRLAKALR